MLDGLTSAVVDLLKEFEEPAGDVGCLATEDRSVAGTDLTWALKESQALGGITSDITATDLLHGDGFDVEADVVTWDSLDELLVTYLHRLDFRGDVDGSEDHNHARLDSTSLNTTDQDCTDTTDLVHISKREVKWLIRRALRWSTASMASSRVLPVALALVSFSLPSSDELLDTEGVGEESVLKSLFVLGDTSFELTGARGYDEYDAVGVRGPGDHVLDEVAMTGAFRTSKERCRWRCHAPAQP